MASRAIDKITLALEAAVNKNPEGHLRSIPVVLSRRSFGEVDGNLDDTTTTRAYFLASKDTIKFRHEGNENGIPPTLFLKDLSNKQDKILVYYSASGSGKTSELVGSSASRDAHLAVVISVEDPPAHLMPSFLASAEEDFARGRHRNDEMTSPGSQDISRSDTQSIDEDQFLRRHVNKQKADYSIYPKLLELFEEAKEEILPVIETAMSAEKPLKIILAIDEASSCPDVIRGILRFPNHVDLLVASAMENVFPTHKIELHVNFSVAGTGVASSTIGSLVENFSVLRPFHGKAWRSIVDRKLGEQKLKMVVPWSDKREIIDSTETLERHLPVIDAMLMNGRMASIALAELRNYAQKGDVLQESTLMDRIVERFMNSNGLASLVDDSRLRTQVGAAALAVHLFRNMPQFRNLKIPDTSVDIAEFAANMQFFTFDNSCEVSVKQLVTQYGLLEPSATITRNHRNTIISPPLLMEASQQLICLHMLGLDTAALLEPTWFGFEQMVTHFVKCSIAASLTVPTEKRPSIQDVLKQIGCSIDNNATSTVVATRFEEMGQLKATSTVPCRSADGNPYYDKTRQMQTGLAITEEQGLAKLHIEKLLHSAVTNCRGRSLSTGIGLPIACINEGNSCLCDGIVTFWAYNTNGGVANPAKVSIMIQAKDYRGTNLNHTDLNKHAEVCGDSILDEIFGKRRLLCVASGHESLVATRKCLNKRKYIPFALSSCDLVAELLPKLKKGRSAKRKRELFAHVVTFERRTDTGENRKRKLSEDDQDTVSSSHAE